MSELIISVVGIVASITGVFFIAAVIAGIRRAGRVARDIRANQ